MRNTNIYNKFVPTKMLLNSNALDKSIYFLTQLYIYSFSMIRVKNNEVNYIIIVIKRQKTLCSQKK